MADDAHAHAATPTAPVQPPTATTPDDDDDRPVDPKLVAELWPWVELARRVYEASHGAGVAGGGSRVH